MPGNNERLFVRALRYLVGGVDSPVRAFNYVGGAPLLIKKGRGAKIYDYDAKEYIDYVLSWGSLILGHAHPKVIGPLRKKIASGLSFGTTSAPEIKLAGLISRAVPFAEKVRFVNSGTEAVMGAIRLARGYTHRDKVIKFRHSYHGHADYLLASSGSGLATLSIPQGAGVPRDFLRHTIVTPYGDKEYLEKVFRRQGDRVAAVIFEPAGGNHGVIPPDTVFLKYLRDVAREYGALLIADEVITGFRFCFGSLIGSLGIKPDLVCLGKIIGGGLPVGAYGGNNKIMEHLAPLGEVYQASTFSGNPVVMQAGLSTLETLAGLKEEYPYLDGLAAEVAGVIEEGAATQGLPLKVRRFGSMFSLKFEDTRIFRVFYKALLRERVYFAPSEYEANFLSFAHTQKDIAKTKEAVKSALARAKKG